MEKMLISKIGNRIIPMNLIIGLILIIYPLASFLHFETVDLANLPFFSQWKIAPDMFAWSKSSVILLGALLLVPLLLLHKINGVRSRAHLWIYLCPALWLSGHLIATTFASHTSIALWGFPLQKQGLLLYAAYFIFFIAATRIESPLRFGWVWLLAPQLPAAIGLSQFFGHYPLEWSWVKALLTHNLAANQDFTFKWSNSGSVSSTLFNPNYAGFYFALSCSVLLTLLLTAGQKRQRWQILAALVLPSLALLGSHSLASLMAFGMACVLAFCWLFWPMQNHHQSILNKKVLISALGVILFLMGGLRLIWNSPFGQPLRSRFARLNTDLGNTSSLATANNYFYLFQKNGALILGPNHAQLRITGSSREITFNDASGQPLNYQNTDGIMRFNNVIYSDYKLRPWSDGKNNFFNFQYQNYSFDLQLLPLGPEVWVNYESVVPRRAARLFQSRESGLSGRFFIWSRALSLVSNSFIGYGPGHFALVFPQDDLEGKLNAVGSLSRLTEAAHNSFIQQGIEGGWLALLAWIALLLLPLRFMKFRNWPYYLPIVVVIINGCSSDMTIYTSTLCWIYLGCCYKINLNL